ncbi:transcription elongation factor A N-terminal and central domain-containing protein isoform X2 [Phyllopteryx taeniolatus]|uniref:transcription elongation factor A N-terminal and central domain-containing protein isoform X2 n=1 Tax=Phyllopteryx taeniolatus TaxID=161469 RepID=UPI002AD42BF4|nr:transcription elongation factor A N-terminal and central domain-containing protein isoform X2 [Phyllopteryx taeniolatus]
MDFRFPERLSCDSSTTWRLIYAVPSFETNMAAAVRTTIQFGDFSYGSDKVQWNSKSGMAETEQEASSSCSSSSCSSSSSSVAEVDHAEGAAASLRSKCVGLLASALHLEAPDGDKATELAAQVERHVRRIHASDRVKYKACVRSKVANLRNPKNGHLRQGLASGSLTPEAFARMTAEEMACAELRQLREEYSSRGVSERQLPRGPEGTATRRLRCRRCGGFDCTVTRLNRGVLFLPAWARQGGPDDPAVTFVTCSRCGQRWYHSGWLCL